jgi:hypothetical protein
MPEVQKIPEHPVGLIERINRLQPEPFEYEFSKYIYVPQSTKDDREYLRLPSAQALNKYEELLLGLKEKQELALHSRIFNGSECLHFPMLDLAEEFSDLHVKAISSLMCEFNIPQFAAYHSGRSAHIYGLGLLTGEKMIQFLARALLLNLPGKETIVDSRWIGHRIYAGYGSLRWSCNTKQYLSAPKAIGLFSAV